MLISCKYLGANRNGNYFKIVDDDFECEIAAHNSSRWEVIVREYRKRGLPVGPNLVRAAIDYSKEIHKPVAEILEYQVSLLKEDYQKEIKERNEYVRKLGAFF